MPFVSWLVYSLLWLSSSLVLAAPAAKPKPSASTPAPPKILGPQPPHFVAYSDESEFGIPSSKDLAGFNTLILSFLLASGPADQAQAWTQLSSSQRASIKADYKRNNITLLVSAFGSTESPTTNHQDPTQLAQTMAQWVKDWGMDGIDVDYEDFEAVGKGQAVSWLETFTTVLRDNLPAGQFVISHAPVAPWFGTNQPYAQLHKSVGNLIDWYNVQFYSQGTAYTSCDTLIHQSGGDFPGTSVLEIVGSGVEEWKVVLGKPGTPADVGDPVPSDGGGGGTQEAGDTQEAGGTQDAGGTQEAGGGGTEVASGSGTQEASGSTQEASGSTQEASGGGTQEAGGFIAARTGSKDASSSFRSTRMGGSKGTKVAHAFGRLDRRSLDPHINGFLETDTLAECLVQAKTNGWNAGVMVWEYPDADSQWMQSVRELAWPL